MLEIKNIAQHSWLYQVSQRSRTKRNIWSIIEYHACYVGRQMTKGEVVGQKKRVGSTCPKNPIGGNFTIQDGRQNTFGIYKG